MGKKNREIAEYYKKQRRGEQDDKMLDRIVGGGKRQRAAKAEERKAKREYRDARGRTYTVVPGDSWFSIAGSELGDQRYAGELARANPGFDVLNPGAVLRLPPLDENETPVLTYGDQETLEDIQEKLEAAQEEAEEAAISVETETDPLEFYEERKRGFVEMGETGAYGLEEEYEYEAEAQALAQELLAWGVIPPQAEENTVTLPQTEESEGSLKVAAPAREEDVQVQEDLEEAEKLLNIWFSTQVADMKILGQDNYPFINAQYQELNNAIGDGRLRPADIWRLVYGTEYVPTPTPTATEGLPAPGHTIIPADTATPAPSTEIPAPEVGLFDQKEPSEALYYTYVVSEGETLSDIQVNTGVDYPEIQDVNEIDSELITVGQVIYIPVQDETILLDDATYIYSEASRQLLDLAVSGDFPIDYSIRPEGADKVYSAADNQLILDNMNLIMGFAAEYDLDTNQLAYILATAQIESGLGGDMEERYNGNDKEGYFEELYRAGTKAGDHLGNLVDGDGNKYHGRGFVQLTGRAGYQYYSDLFGVDILENPDLLINDAELAAKILVDGIVNGSFKSFHYTNPDNPSEGGVTADGDLPGIKEYDLSDQAGFSVAREIVNSDNPVEFAALAADYACLLSTLCAEGLLPNSLSCAAQGGC